MIVVTIEGTNYECFTTWDDLTLAEYIRLGEIEIPPRLKALWVDEKNIEASIAAVTQEDLEKNFPAYYVKVLGLFSNIPPLVITGLSGEVVTTLFNDYLAIFTRSLIYSVPLEMTDKLEVHAPEEVESFMLESVKYYLPKVLRLQGQSIPLADEKIIAFAEASDLDLSSGENNSDAPGKLPLFMGIYCRKQYEEYSEELALSRQELFLKAKMSTVWAVFFLHRKAYDFTVDMHQNIFKTGAANDRQSDYKKSGLADFGWRGMIYEVAQAGGLGTVKEVEQAKLYDFMSYLSYLRAQAKLEELASKRIK